jgi:hypothetical protein
MRSKIRTLAWRSRASRLLAHDLVGFAVHLQRVMAEAQIEAAANSLA